MVSTSGRTETPLAGTAVGGCGGIGLPATLRPMTEHDRRPVHEDRWREHQDRWARERLEPALDRNPERRGRFITQSGVEIARVYTPADLHDPANDPDAGRPR